MNVDVLCLVFICYVQHITMATKVESVAVETDVGTFVGYIRRFNAFGQDLAVRRFLGIPYAEPPLGNLRFAKPVRKAKLNEPFDVTEHGPTCIQQDVNLGGNRKPGRMESLKYSEDCLLLNIFTPDSSGQTDELLPVMIYIHGGAYVFGSPQFYPHDVISSYGNVVAVTIAYRLSVWGFMSTGDQELPGNYGLWDQHMAIQWVHENIDRFGGNPNAVMIYGSSAGGSSVVYQGLYPGNQRLVHRVSAQSGTITCGFALNKDPISAARKIGKLVGCEDDSSSKMLADCLKAKSTEELKNALEVNEKLFRAFSYQFVPVIDGDFIHEEPTDIFYGTSSTAERNREVFSNIDLMVGVNSGEGLITFVPFYEANDSEKFDVNRSKFEEELVPIVVKTVFGPDIPSVLSDVIVGEYTHWEDPDNISMTRESFIKLSSDYKYNIRVIETANIHAESSDKNTFLYFYDAFTSQHHFPVPEWANKPNHVDEMTSLLGYDNEDGFTSWTTPYSDDPPADWELELTKAHIKMWTNFARTGNPNGPADIQDYTNTEWPKYERGSEQYIHITRQMSADSVGRRLFAREVNFWTNVLPRVINEVNRTPWENTDDDKNYCERDTDCKP